MREAPRRREARVGAHAARGVVAAVEVRVVEDRRARDGAKARFCAVSRALAQTRARRAISSGRVEQPLQHLHAAERAADRGVQPLDAQVRAAAAGARPPGRAIAIGGKSRP